MQAMLTQHIGSLRPFIIADTNTHQLCLPYLLEQIPNLVDAPVIGIPFGETHKSLSTLRYIWNQLLLHNVNKQSVILNLGGGMVTDIGGFAAATYMRGIPYINIPTTLLATVDAAHGGKTGIDFEGIKNLLGTFTMPNAVVIDPTFLNTLPTRQLLAGFAEMLKYGLIFDAGLWNDLKTLNPLNGLLYQDYIQRCIDIKTSIVLTDPTDQNMRQSLNFGHTVGHAFEAYFLATADELLHGEAVAWGMVAEAFIAHKKGVLTLAELEDIKSVITKLYSPLPHFDDDRIIALCIHDKKNSQTINLSLIGPVGKAHLKQPTTVAEIKKALHFCRA